MTEPYVVDSDDFRAGVAYAAHLLRHVIFAAHGGQPWVSPMRVRNRCCREAVIDFAQGMASGMEERNGVVADHSHPAEDADPSTACAGTCAGELTQRMAALGVEISVSAQPPAVAGPYATEPFTCPHGTAFFIYPTGEQIAAWIRDGVA